ncbi:hypothetical protein KP509_15G020600 [Ceratopteris richardii]|uniref:Uncharacterized protein n=1 Tax=Ceratopteris richardii TaxID=49495 RepID=A0A8T2T5A9_CERRI|nr:hypothetical protein KP509_15G020600 [Ceratopteris richardii]
MKKRRAVDKYPSPSTALTIKGGLSNATKDFLGRSPIRKREVREYISVVHRLLTRGRQRPCCAEYSEGSRMKELWLGSGRYLLGRESTATEVLVSQNGDKWLRRETHQQAPDTVMLKARREDKWKTWVPTTLAMLPANDYP